MTAAEILYLKTKYDQDPSFAYECSDEDLNMLLNIFGEMEPIIDALNVRAGASDEQRAQDIGCDPEDFRAYDESQTVSVSDLIAAAEVAWQYGV